MSMTFPQTCLYIEIDKWSLIDRKNDYDQRGSSLSTILVIIIYWTLLSHDCITIATFNLQLNSKACSINSPSFSQIKADFADTATLKSINKHRIITLKMNSWWTTPRSANSETLPSNCIFIWIQIRSTSSRNVEQKSARTVRDNKEKRKKISNSFIPTRTMYLSIRSYHYSSQDTRINIYKLSTI